MSYAAIAAKNAPPEAEQPHPSQDLLEGGFRGETELPELPDVNHKMAVVDRDWAAHPETETSTGVKADTAAALLDSVHHAPPPVEEPHVSEVAPDPTPAPSKAEAEQAAEEKRKQAKADADALKKDLNKAAGKVEDAAGQVKEHVQSAAGNVNKDVHQASSAVKKDASAAASAVKDDVKSAAADVKAKVDDAAAGVKAKVNDAAANAPSSAEEAGARTGAAIDNAAHKAKQISHQAEAKAKAASNSLEARAEDLARDVKSAAAQASDKASSLGHDAERKAHELKKQAGEKLERAESALEGYTTRAREILLRPGTLGGLMGIANVGLISTLGYYAYTRRHAPAWNRNYVAAALAGTLSLFATEAIVAERYSTTPEGQQELKRAKEEGSRAYVHAREIILRPQVAGGALGALNVAVLAVLGYFGYQNWNKPAWDKKLVSAITCGLISLSAAEGLAANAYKQKELPRQKRKGNA